MTPKSTVHVIQGMQKDTSKSKLSKEFAFDAKNIRITARDDNSLLSITNEKGTTHEKDLSGNYIGHCIINNQLVLFTTNGNTDFIFLYDSSLNQSTLYSGNLNFSVDNPLETLGVYENEDIQKVYWVDGRNQPRIINIASTEEVKSKWNNNSFDFIQELNLKENISIEAVPNSSMFSQGVIQYAFSYYKKYGQESNIFDVSPLCYIAQKNRGAAPDEVIKDTAFKIKIDNADTIFDYLRIYSIHRTSLDAVPTVKVVTDLPLVRGPEVLEIKKEATIFSIKNFNQESNFYYNGTLLEQSAVVHSYTENTALGDRTYMLAFNKVGITHRIIEVRDNNGILHTIEVVGDNLLLKIAKDKKNSRITFKTLDVGSYTTSLIVTTIEDNPNPEIVSVEYIDNGTSGYTIDPTNLLYIGGENIIPKSITQKDNTLFLGNIKISTPRIPDDIKDEFKTLYSKVVTKYKTININNTTTKNYTAEESSRINDDSYFKAGEIYRLGAQFQYYNGKWSEPIYIGDITQDLDARPSKNSNDCLLPILSLPITNSIKTKLEELKVKKIRGLVVYPNYSDRKIIAQGILCPTVFNTDRRANNNPYAQSSWLLRPNIYKDFSKDDFSDNNSTTNINSGSCVEFRHNRALLTGANRGSEIQNNVEYKVDQSILTLHSPEVEFDELLHYEDAKLRIVGITVLTNNYSDIDIQIEGSTTAVNAGGFIKYDVTSYYSGDRSLISGTFFEDFYFTPRPTPDDPSDFDYGLVYLWQRSGSLNTDSASEAESNDRAQRAVLKKKRISNIKSSNFNIWLSKDNIWKALGGIGDDSSYANGISKVTKFDSDQKSLVKIEGHTDMNYFGNVDDLLTTTIPYNIYYANTQYGELKAATKNSKEYTSKDAVRIKYKSSPHLVFALNKATTNNHTIVLPTLNNLNSINNTVVEQDSNLPDPKDVRYIKYRYDSNLGNIQHEYWENGDIIAMPNLYNYNILEFWIYEDGLKRYNPDEEVWLYYEIPNTFYIDVYKPIVGNYGTKSWQYYATISVKTDDSDNDGKTKIKQDSITVSYEKSLNDAKAYLYLAELYRENDNNTSFGGTSDIAIQNNLWIPAGKSNLLDEKTILYEYGDTRYQRYDCLKTYAFTPEDENQVVEIASFLCETKVNMLGRYDRNIGNLSNLNADPTNFNLFNPVYSQKNNFFNYRILDSDFYKLQDFTNTITWSKEKHAGEEIDTWTNITMANTLDLDGTKGKITGLISNKDKLLCFQESGFSQILFNSRVQIPATDGVPIEITNGYKVDGFRYISDTVGCQNKKSIVITPSGVYFLDSEGNSIYNYEEGLINLSTQKGFDIWTKEVANDPTFKTFYDKNNKDIYFTTKDYCLCFSEKIGQFTSFYDYNGIDTMFNIGNNFYSIKESKIYSHFTGLYNYIYDSFRPYWITLIANENPYVDKVFNTVEFRADLFSGDQYNPTSIPFNSIEVKNEYQEGNSTLSYNNYTNPAMKKKFRTWRVNIPRDKDKKLDRMRNPWLQIKLSNTTPSSDKMELHDIIVHYFE